MTCDHVDCEAEAEWSLEVCPMPNDGASVVYACTQHVGDLSDGVTEAHGLGAIHIATKPPVGKPSIGGVSAGRMQALLHSEGEDY